MQTRRFFRLQIWTAYGRGLKLPAVEGVFRANSLSWLVPDERIELPTFGLQNRCSTAELIRRFDGFCAISEASRAQERG
jgi:hypothetical protein